MKPATRHRLLILFLAFFAGLGATALLERSRAEAQEVSSTAAPPSVAEGVITRIVEQKMVEGRGEPQLYQRLEVRLTSGPRTGQLVEVEAGDIAEVNVQSYKVDDRLLVDSSPDATGGEGFYIVDRVRSTALYILFGVFIAVTVLIGRGRGLASLGGMILTFGVIFFYVLPQISAGREPIGVAIGSALLVIPITFSMSHGLNRKTAAAIVGTVIALIIAALLASAFVDAAQLTGYASEEAGFLQVAQQGRLNVRGLLLASIIIGLLGILDDITVSQAAVVYQLHRTSRDLPLREIYTRAMDVGRDHIASLVNTLVLVYTSAAMPLLLLFLRDTTSFSMVINYEIVAEEIVRTLVASIGLILAVPITTVVSCMFIARETETMG